MDKSRKEEAASAAGLSFLLKSQINAHQKYKGPTQGVGPFPDSAFYAAEAISKASIAGAGFNTGISTLTNLPSATCANT